MIWLMGRITPPGYLITADHAHHTEVIGVRARPRPMAWL